MCLDFVVQHELQGGARDLIVIDHEHASLVHCFCRFNSDLHCILLNDLSASAARLR